MSRGFRPSRRWDKLVICFYSGGYLIIGEVSRRDVFLRRRLTGGPVRSVDVANDAGIIGDAAIRYRGNHASVTWTISSNLFIFLFLSFILFRNTDGNASGARRVLLPSSSTLRFLKSSSWRSLPPLLHACGGLKYPRCGIPFSFFSAVDREELSRERPPIYKVTEDFSQPS